LAEARRLGEMLGQTIESALERATFLDDLAIDIVTASTELPLRAVPTVQAANLNLQRARSYVTDLQERGAARADVRTAQCAVFGAEETLTLARFAANGQLATAAGECLPGEIQIFSIGPWRLVGWPGEIFAEFAIELKQNFTNTHVITLANGELQGYLVTAEAVANNTYEASNAIFASPESGRILLEVTSNLLKRFPLAEQPCVVGRSVKS
jgi:hypothetical protein